MRRLSRLRPTMIAMGLAATLVNTVQAETVFTKKISYFQISGRTADDLDRELERRGPYTSSTGTRHPGATRIKFGGDITYVERDGRCRIQSARVTVSAHIILPRWTNRKRAPNSLGLVWDTLSRDIKRHEERHAEIAKQHATALEHSLTDMRSRRTCEELQQQVDLVSQEAIEAHDRDQARFDRSEAVNFEKRMIRLLENRIKSNSP